MTEYLITGLVAARTYRLKVQSSDVNGLGIESNVVEQIACIQPEDMALPVLDAVTRTTFTLSWQLPAFIGGCRISGFAIYRDDGNNGDMNIPVDAAVLADRSDILQHTATLTGFTGVSFHVKVVAINEIGEAESNGLHFILADVPAQPSPAPSSGIYTTIDQIHVVYENTNTDDGGSPILFYELEMDDGRLGEFTSV